MPHASVVVIVAMTLLAGALSAAAPAQVAAPLTSLQDIEQLTATADFNGDGQIDLAVGAPDDDVGATADAGAVNIFYGTADGLPGTASQTLVQGNPEAGDRFGAALDR